MSNISDSDKRRLVNLMSIAGRLTNKIGLVYNDTEEELKQNLDEFRLLAQTLYERIEAMAEEKL